VNRPIPRSILPGLLASTLLAGCTLHRLPDPKTPDCAPASSGALWECIDGIPRQDKPESAFASTSRVANPTRKTKDRALPSACEGPTPPGFSLVNEEEMGPGRAPLIAYLAPPRDGAAPIVLVVHGMFDSKNTKYVRVTGELLRGEGFGVVIPDMRWHGCLLERQWLPTLGIEEGPDLVAWGRWLIRTYPGHPIGLVGFSLGGLSVLHAIGAPEAAHVFRAGAVVVTPAAALPRAVEHLDSTQYFLDAGLTALFLPQFRAYLEGRMKNLDIPAADGPPFARFLRWLAASLPPDVASSPEDLLARADPAPGTARARRPLLILETANDPIIPAAAPESLGMAASHNPFAHLIETPYGGHIGQPGASPNWFAAVVTTFFRYSAGVAD
jgi:predicted alpha/beta-fold hydrolase